MAELLVWPALIAYGEAAVAYAGASGARGRRRASASGVFGSAGSRRPRSSSCRCSTTDGFPWGTWAGALNLFVWLVVGAYLIWGCTPRYRLLGLAVMPFAAALLVAAWAGGGTGVSTRRSRQRPACSARWPDACGIRGPDTRRRACRPLSLAGATAQAPRCRSSPAAAAAARSLDRLSARTALISLGVLSRRHRRRTCELRSRRLRRADGGHPGDLGALCRWPPPAPRDASCGDGGLPSCSSPASRSLRSSSL